jgi:hypothetical protein
MLTHHQHSPDRRLSYEVQRKIEGNLDFHLTLTAILNPSYLPYITQISGAEIRML